MNAPAESLAAAVASYTAARDRMLVAWALHRTDREDMRKLFRYIRTIRATARLSQEVKHLAAVEA